MTNDEIKNRINETQTMYGVVVGQLEVEGRPVVVLSSIARNVEEALLYAGATKETPVLGIACLKVVDFLPIQTITGAWSWRAM
jgi:hypothetical protein